MTSYHTTMQLTFQKSSVYFVEGNPENETETAFEAREGRLLWSESKEANCGLLLPKLFASFPSCRLFGFVIFSTFAT